MNSSDHTDVSRPNHCPFCKEEIAEDAVKCKHCGSRLRPDPPAHGGVCPMCKEEINKDAIKCKHCQSIVGVAAQSAPDEPSIAAARAAINPMVGPITVPWGPCLWTCYCVRYSDLFPNICNEWRCVPIYCANTFA